jgi:hypothetical protein
MPHASVATAALTAVLLLGGVSCTGEDADVDTESPTTAIAPAPTLGTSDRTGDGVNGDFGPDLDGFGGPGADGDADGDGDDVDGGDDAAG